MPEVIRLTRRDIPTRTSGTLLSEVRRPAGEVAKKAAASVKKAKKPKSDG